MGLFPAAASKGFESVAVAARRVLRCLPGDADASNEYRLEEGVTSVEMETSGSSGMRNRFALEQPTSTPNEAETSPTTTEGIPTPSSNEDSFQSTNQDDLKESFVKTTIRRLSTGLKSTAFSLKTADEKKDLNHTLGYDRFVKEQYEKYPKGFPQLAAWVSSDEDLPMIRGFNYLHNRLLIQDMVEIGELEKELLEADKHEDANPFPNCRLLLTAPEEDGNTKHRELIETIRTKLKEYRQLALEHKQFQAFGKPIERNFLAYYKWIWRNPPLGEGYNDYIRHKDDMLSLKINHLNIFANFIEEHIHHWPLSMTEGWFRPKEERDKTSDENVTYYSETRRNTIAGILLVLSAVSTLIVPVFLLFLVQMSRVMMCVTTSIFILVFAGLLYLATQRDVYQVFVGTAAYSAILVVFLGNISTGNGPAGVGN